MRKAHISNKPDYLLALLVLGITIFGVVVVYDASVVLAHEQFGDKLYFFKNQVLWALIGFAFAILAARIDYHYWKKLALPALIFSVVCLILVFLPGVSTRIYGAKRWLATPAAVSIPIVRRLSFQPSEVAKISLILFLSSWLSEKDKSKKKKMKTLIPFMLIIGIICGLVVLQPDMGTTVVMVGASFLVYFLSGVGLFEVCASGFILGFLGLILSLTSEYRWKRVLTFLHLIEDKLETSYHINQILIALGSGGLFGLGLGHSRQKYQYLPEVTTDSIFAIIGEELGFWGSVSVLALLFLVVWRGLRIAEQAPDKFGYLLAGGLTGILGVQTIVNLGAQTSLLPLTGLTLPFISYGGSSLTIMLIGVGILLNISKQSRV